MVYYFIKVPQNHENGWGGGGEWAYIGVNNQWLLDGCYHYT